MSQSNTKALDDVMLDWLEETINWAKQNRRDINPEDIRALVENERMGQAISLLMAMAFHAGVAHQKTEQ